jgi:hypothetical protein
VDIEKEALFTSMIIVEALARQKVTPASYAISITDYDEEADYVFLRKPHRWSFKEFKSIVERVVTILSPLNMPICRIRVSTQGYHDWLTRSSLKDTADHRAEFSVLPNDERTTFHKVDKAEGDPIMVLDPSQPVEVLELFGDPEVDAFTTTAHSLIEKGFGHCTLEFNGNRDEMALLVLPMSAFKLAKKVVSLDADVKRENRSTKRIPLDSLRNDSVVFALKKLGERSHGTR